MHVPLVLTLLNLSGGIAALVAAFHGHAVMAGWLVVFSMLSDFLDGHVARWLKLDSDIGRELDSLADMVSFGAVPPLITYCSLASDYNLFLLTAAAIFSACAAVRLAKFNLGSSAGGYFSGLPSTMAGGFMAALAVNKIYTSPWAAALVLCLLSCLMVSPIPYFSLKGVSSKFRFYVISISAFIITGALILKSFWVICVLFGMYVLSGPLYYIARVLSGRPFRRLPQNLP